MKVLLSAYGCEPGVGSEEGIGWSWARQVAMRNDCVLVTRKNNVQAIEQAAAREGLSQLEVVGYDWPLWTRFWKRRGRGAMLYFYMWQLGLALVCRKLDRKHNFDLVQHVTFASSWIPSGLAFVGKPLLWGPVGQHPRIPAQVLAGAPIGIRFAEAAKAGIKSAAVRVDPFLRFTVKRAARVLSLGSEFEKCASLLRNKRVERLHACGVDRLTVGPKTGGHILFSGRFVSLKGPDLALEAFARAREGHPGLRMTFLGSGPLESKLRARVAELGIASAVSFPGKLPLDEALALMGTADIFLFPSFEGAGMVVPEAMASGAVVLCIDFGGPGDMVEHGRGLAVELGVTRAETCDNLSAGLLSLLADPELCQAMRAKAEQWIQDEMLWDQKGDRLQRIYQDVMAETSNKTK